jgi:hypothetical protein
VRSTVTTRTIFREPLHCGEKHEQKRYFAAAALKKRNRIRSPALFQRET